MITYYHVSNKTQTRREENDYYCIRVEHRERYQRYLQFKFQRKIPNVYRISQDEFKIASNYMLEGLPVYIFNKQVPPLNLTPEQAKFQDHKEYTEVAVETWDELPSVYHEYYQRFKDFFQSICARRSVTLTTHQADLVRRYIKTPTNKRESFIREQAWNFVQDAIKKKAKAYAENRKLKFLGDLELRNQCYKNIMYTAMKHGITAYSPCARTYFEVKAMLDFRENFNVDTPVSDEQIAYIESNARKWGLEIPVLKYFYATREAFHKDRNEDGDIVGATSHGFTEEICEVRSTRDNYNETRFGNKITRDFEQVRRTLHPNNFPEDAFVTTYGTTPKQYLEVYNKIRWFESLPERDQDFFIAEDHCRCPHCGEITRKLNNHNVDIRCEYCDGLLEELVCVSNDHLLYGTDIDNAYSDLEDVQAYIDNVENTYEQDEYDE